MWNLRTKKKLTAWAPEAGSYRSLSPLASMNEKTADKSQLPSQLPTDKFRDFGGKQVLHINTKQKG